MANTDTTPIKRSYSRVTDNKGNLKRVNSITVQPHLMLLNLQYALILGSTPIAQTNISVRFPQFNI
jgi:hypothetical protein